ncbi:MAG: DUF349 domain-containing protein [Bacteroidota bacterium]
MENTDTQQQNQNLPDQEENNLATDSGSTAESGNSFTDSNGADISASEASADDTIDELAESRRKLQELMAAAGVSADEAPEAELAAIADDAGAEDPEGNAAYVAELAHMHELEDESAEIAESKTTSDAPAEEPVAATPIVTEGVYSTDLASGESAEADHSEDGGEEEADHAEPVGGYDSLDRAGLVTALEQILKDQSYLKNTGSLGKIRQAYDAIFEGDRAAALAKYTEEGGNPDDFKYRRDDLGNKFEDIYRQVRDKRRTFMQEQEKNKETALKTKTNLLDQLRALVDGEDNRNSMNTLKKIQEEWKAAGPADAAKNRELSASYGVLLDKFYNNRSIYNELRELDRRKNTEAKLDVIARAEKLQEYTSISKALKELNELHDEYKSIGPVNKDDQEAFWQKFKAISDTIYTKRREMTEKLSAEQGANLDAKNIILEKMEAAVRIKTDRIDDWNKQTEELNALHQEWKAIGPVPKEKTSDLNKRFTGIVRGFYADKTKFFKDLDAERRKNLKALQTLTEQAETLKDSEDWDTATAAIKDLQAQWKETSGPVPFKLRNPLFDRFKVATDAFFERKREKFASGGGGQTNYAENLKARQDIIAQIEQHAADKTGDLETLKALTDEYMAVGFVQRKDVDAIQARYKKAISDLLANSESISDADRSKYKSETQGARRSFDGPRRDNQSAGSAGGDGPRRYEHSNRGEYRGGGGGGGNSNSPEMQLRKKINNLENQIHLWNNNLAFFSNSRNADALRKEVAGKVSVLEGELKDLKSQLKNLSNSEA